MATKLDLLQSQLAQVLEKGDQLRRKAQNAALTSFEATELSEAHENGLKLKKAIEEEQKRVLDSDFADLQKFMDGPQYKVSRNTNADDDAVKTYSQAGWENKGGVIHVPTTKGLVPMFREEVLIGPIPQDDKVVAEYYQKTRAIVQPTYRTAYGNFIRKAARQHEAAMAFMDLSAEERKALSEGSDGEGGYLVPPDLQAEIIVRLPQTAVMRRLARVVNTSRDRVLWPRVLPHSDTNLESIYSSGFVGSWVGETPAFSETDPGFGQFEISIKKLRTATKLSNDFVADAVTDILAWLAMNGSEAMGLTEDSAFINGLGTPLVPQGFLQDAGLKTADVEGSTSDTISNTAAANGSANKLINLAYALPSQYAARAEWLMRRAIEGKIRVLVDGAGRYLWPAMTDSGFIGRLPPLMGSPVNNSEFMPADGTDAAKVVAYGDFSNYIIAQRTQISTVILRERFADTDQLGIILFERVGGALSNNDAIRVGIV